MVSFYKPKKSPRSGADKVTKVTVTIDDVDAFGQGVCRQHAPILFVDNALPGETCDVKVTRKSKHHWSGKAVRISQPHSARQAPFCSHASQCGGCHSQHVDADAMLAWRQGALDEQIKRQLSIAALPWCQPVSSERPAYRRKARLAIDSRNPKAFKMGYREQGSKNIIDIDACPILVPELARLLSPLKNTLSALSGRKFLGHVSLMAADNLQQVALRVTRELNTADTDLLQQFAIDNQVQLVLEPQEKPPVCLSGEEQALICETHDNLHIRAKDSDFIQVNKAVNSKMVAQAMAWLAPQPSDVIADWFCGLGNFTLPLAKSGASVSAVEGVPTMVERGAHNAQLEGMTGINWVHHDLNDGDAVREYLASQPNKILLDPSRDGARVACEQIAKSQVEQVLYVSCNPASFIRDAAFLLAGGYKLDKIGLLEMFPFTQHVELMALFSHPRTVK